MLNTAVWSINEMDFNRAKRMYKTKVFDSDFDFIGQLKFANICFDFIVRPYDDAPMLTADMYVFGIDSGYGKTEDGIPYSYEDGIDFDEPLVYELSLDEFKSLAFDVAIHFAEKKLHTKF